MHALRYRDFMQTHHFESHCILAFQPHHQSELAQHHDATLVCNPWVRQYAYERGRPRLIAALHARRGTWRDTEFKEYNFDALGLPPACGALHPLLKARHC